MLKCVSKTFILNSLKMSNMRSKKKQIMAQIFIECRVIDNR